MARPKRRADFFLIRGQVYTFHKKCTEGVKLFYPFETGILFVS